MDDRPCNAWVLAVIFGLKEMARSLMIKRTTSHTGLSPYVHPRRSPMSLNARSILLIVAVICFVLAAVGVGLGSISLEALGLAAFAGAFLLGDGGIKLRS